MSTRRPRFEPVPLQPHEAEAISTPLLGWFAANHRPMPWREVRDPYGIWVSEVMLQQTQVATVIPYFERFMTRFPTIRDLAEAPLDDVLKHWEGLGYYSRARNLHAAAQKIMREHGGIFPQDHAQILALPGIGDYTAGAIASIAFNQARPAVDGNVFRVLARLFMLPHDIARPQSRPIFEDLAQRLIPGMAAWRFNQALMELGATVCTPARPQCPTCPISFSCKAKGSGMWCEFPVKARKAAPRDISFVVAVIEHEGSYLVVRRPNKGLLGGLWEFPTFEMTGKEAIAEGTIAVREIHCFSLEEAAKLVSVPHQFTHLRAMFHAFQAKARAGEPLPIPGETLRWCAIEELNDLAMPLAQQKIAQALRKAKAQLLLNF